jgi:hypothetical protein
MVTALDAVTIWMSLSKGLLLEARFLLHPLWV